MIFQASVNKKESGHSHFYIRRDNFNPKVVIKISIHHQEDTIVNIYAPNSRYHILTDFKGERQYNNCRRSKYLTISKG